MASPGLFVKVTNLPEIERYFGTLAEAAAEMARLRLAAGSPLGYAPGIEKGYDRAGNLRRRAGGAWMLRRGLAAAQQDIAPLLPVMLTRGTAAGKDLTDAIRRTLLGNIQRWTPVRKGTLRDSFIVRAGH